VNRAYAIFLLDLNSAVEDVIVHFRPMAYDEDVLLAHYSEFLENAQDRLYSQSVNARVNVLINN